MPILAPQHTTLTPENKGQIGVAACITSLITIKRGNDYVTVAALFDSGSESSYFHPDLERLGVTRKAKNFTLETLSMEQSQETVSGLMCGFDILMANGDLKPWLKKVKSGKKDLRLQDDKLWPRLVAWCVEIARGLECLESLSIVHRDLAAR